MSRLSIPHMAQEREATISLIKRKTEPDIIRFRFAFWADYLLR